MIFELQGFANMNNPEKGHLIEMYVKTKLTELGYDIFTPLSFQDQ